MKHLQRAAYCNMMSMWGISVALFYVFGSPEEPLKRMAGALTILCFSSALSEWATVEKKRYEDEYGEL